MIQQKILTYAVNSVWQVPMLMTAAWLVIRCCRPSVTMQHRLWLATLALAVLAPFRGIGAVALPMGMVAPGGVVQASAPADRAVELRPPSALPRQTQAAWPLDMPSMPLRAVRLSQRAAYWLLALYFLAVFWRFARLVYAWRAARNLVASARADNLPGPFPAMLTHMCERIGVAEPQTRLSRAVLSPLTLGIIQPVLVLPEAFAQTSEREMTAVLGHELAHVRRRDYLLNLLCQVGALPIAYHPATYAMQRRLRLTREMVCDAIAADLMHSSSAYAHSLVLLAQRMLDGRELAEHVQAAGMFDNNGLEERVMGLLESKGKINVQTRAIRNYLSQNIHYVLDDACLAGLAMFFRYAAECSVLPTAPPLRFL